MDTDASGCGRCPSPTSSAATAIDAFISISTPNTLLAPGWCRPRRPCPSGDSRPSPRRTMSRRSFRQVHPVCHLTHSPSPVEALGACAGILAGDPPMAGAPPALEDPSRRFTEAPVPRTCPGPDRRSGRHAADTETRPAIVPAPSRRGVSHASRSDSRIRARVRSATGLDTTSWGNLIRATPYTRSAYPGGPLDTLDSIVRLRPSGHAFRDGHFRKRRLPRGEYFIWPRYA